MINAKEEFLRHVAGGANIKAALVRRITDVNEREVHTLPEGYTDEQFEKFLAAINFTYDNCLSGREIDGYIWYKDGTWSERGEFERTEWWAYKRCPDIGRVLYFYEGGE